MQCAKCGAPIQWDPRTQGQCRHCGAAGIANSNDRIALEENAVLDFLKRELTGFSSTYVYPNIPPNKLAGIRNAHGALLGTEPILAIYDGTVFGSASDGFYLTAQRIGWKNISEGPQFLEWHQVGDVTIDDDNDIVIGRARIHTLHNDSDEHAEELDTWEYVLGTLAWSAHPPSEEELLRSKSPHVATGNVVENSTAWPMVTPVEQLQAAPFTPRDTVMSMTVHPSGEVFATADGSVVALRHAVNGASMFAYDATQAVTDLQFSPDGRVLAIVTAAGGLLFIDPYARTVLPAGHAFETGATSLAWLNPTDLVVATDDGSLWMVRSGVLQECIMSGGGAEDEPRLSASPDGTLYAALDDRIVALDLLAKAKRFEVLDATQEGVDVAIAPRAGALVAAGSHGLVIYDATHGQVRARVPFLSPLGIAWTTKSRHVGVSVTGALLGDGALTTSTEEEDVELSFAPRPVVSAPGDLVAVQDSVGNLTILDLKTAQLHRFARATGRAWIESLAWMPDGVHLLLAMSDQSLALWNAHTMQGVFHVAWRG